ncbi:hypothetical protein PR048_031680 [Dryococelus australis]|uniref:Uncharacterized protein n=1 Tax=Dryococelus australis TaxID=614101 RepID=A0ABQ9G5Z4_9NEOP|nr:hypothetical protein PR048_031680 [Dryococelus australis]
MKSAIYKDWAAAAKWLELSLPHGGEPDSISRGVAPGFSQLGLVPDNATEEYTTCIQVDLKQGFQKCSLYREQPISAFWNARFNIFVEKHVFQALYNAIPGRVTGFPQVGIVPNDANGRRVFSGNSRFPHPIIPAPLHIHFNHPHRLSRPRLSPVSLPRFSTSDAQLHSAPKSCPNLFALRRNSNALKSGDIIIQTGAAVVQWTDYSPLTKEIRIPARALSGFWQVGIAPNNVAGRRVFSEISRFVYTDMLICEYAAMKGRGKREFPEKTRRPAATSGTIPTCENPRVARPGIEPSSPWWEASIASPPDRKVAKDDNDITNTTSAGRNGQLSKGKYDIQKYKLDPRMNCNTKYLRSVAIPREKHVEHSPREKHVEHSVTHFNVRLEMRRGILVENALNIAS